MVITLLRNLTLLLCFIVVFLTVSCSKVLEGDYPDPKSIIEAVHQGNVKAVKNMLDKKTALIREVDKEGNTLLHMAVKHNDRAMMELLISKGADPNKPNEIGILPIHLAIAKGFDDVVLWLLNHKASASPDVPVTPLMVAVDHNRKKMIPLLLARGAKVNERNGGALRRAAAGDKVELARYLISLGADVNGAPGSPEDLPLKLAAQNGHAGLIDMFLEKGARINDTSGVTKETALHAATRLGNCDVVELLLEHGADPTLQDAYCKTPLDYAKEKKYAEIIKILTVQKDKKRAGTLHFTRKML